MADTGTLIDWPEEGVTRAPYAVFSDPGIYAAEMRRIFRGPVWHYLGLEAEVPEPGDYRLIDVGDTPVIVLRNPDGGINALVNRCAHKGTMLLFEPFGRVERLMCIYHNWTYDLDGCLKSVPIREGDQRQGRDARVVQHGRERARPAPRREPGRHRLRLLFGRHAAARGLYRRTADAELTAG